MEINPVELDPVYLYLVELDPLALDSVYLFLVKLDPMKFFCPLKLDCVGLDHEL